MLVKFLLTYFASMLLLGGALWGGITLLKKKEIRPKIGAMFLGGGVSIVYLLLLFLLYWSTFNANIDSYFFANSTANNVLVILLIGAAYVFVLSLVRSLILNAACFSAKKRDTGYSFDFGFAAAPAMLVGILYFFNFFVKIYYALFNGPVVWNGEEERFIFGNEIAISPALYSDPMKHLYIMIAMVSFFAILLFGAFIFEGIAKKEYRVIWAIIGTGIVLLLEAVFIASIPWCDFLGWIAIAIVSLIFAAIAGLTARYLPRKKEQQDYTKQFE